MPLIKKRKECNLCGELFDGEIWSYKGEGPGVIPMDLPTPICPSCEKAREFVEEAERKDRQKKWRKQRDYILNPEKMKEDWNKKFIHEEN